MSTHTALPWVLRDETQDSSGGFDIDAWTEDGTETVAQCSELANATFIVNACNNHELLVATLELALEKLELSDEQLFDPHTLPTIKKVLKSARAK